MVIIQMVMVVNTKKKRLAVLDPGKLTNVNTGDIIRGLRKERGWSQGELADKLGLKPQNISRYEKGHVQPRESTLTIFAEVFDVPLTEFTSAVSSLEFPELDPETAEYVRAIPTLSERDQEAVKCILKALVTAKRAQNLFAS